MVGRTGDASPVSPAVATPLNRYWVCVAVHRGVTHVTEGTRHSCYRHVPSRHASPSATSLGKRSESALLSLAWMTG